MTDKPQTIQKRARLKTYTVIARKAFPIFLIMPLFRVAQAIPVVFEQLTMLREDSSYLLHELLKNNSPLSILVYPIWLKASIIIYELIEVVVTSLFVMMLFVMPKLIDSLLKLESDLKSGVSKSG